MGLEDRLKNLNQVMDKEISRSPVFTKRDEEKIMSAIQNTSARKVVKLKRKKAGFVPKVLTAALFAGIIFTSYTVIDNYFTPDSATEMKKPETRYAEEFTQAYSKLTYDEDTRILVIEGTVKNTSDLNSESFQARVNILNDGAAAALGTKSLTLDVPSNNVLKPSESYSFQKVIPLDHSVEKSTFEDAVQVEIYSDTKTLTSFVISNFEYKEVVEDEVDEPTTTNQPAEEVKDNPESKTTEQPTAQEGNDHETSLTELEKKYGKKKSPFDSVNIMSNSGKFFFNGVTMGMKFEEINHILGPYDKHTISNDDLSGHNIARWKVKGSDDFYVHYKGDPGTNYTSWMFTVYLNDNQVKELTTKLGEPYYVNKNGYTFYYLEESQQLLYINDGSLVEEKVFEGSQVVLRFDDNPSLLKSVPPKE